jgi:AMMECR1 domain-containing protein
MDWVLGQHGIRISFNFRGERLGATYLPDVPVEQGWTKEQTLESLMKKARWRGDDSKSRQFLKQHQPWEDVEGNPVQHFRVLKYTGEKASASYDEWQQWRQWLGANGESID